MVHTYVNFCWEYVARDRLARSHGQLKHFFNLIHVLNHFPWWLSQFILPLHLTPHLVLLVTLILTTLVMSNYGFNLDINLIQSDIKIYKSSHETG